MFGQVSSFTHALGMVAERLGKPVDDLELVFLDGAAHIFVVYAGLSRSINKVSRAWPDAVIEPNADGGFRVTWAKMDDAMFTVEYAMVRERT